MFIDTSLRKSLLLRASGPTLIALALSFTFGETIQIMILLLGDDESKAPYLGYILPAALAGSFSLASLAMCGFWFRFGCKQYVARCVGCI
ncbi:hypothetical protein C8J57DRAFT_1312578, partial [Mycena rebaudengoi]